MAATWPGTAARGIDGPLATLRWGFRQTIEAGRGCIIYAGPSATPPSLTLGPTKTVNLWMLGVRPITGSFRFTLNITSPDGTVTPGTPKEVPIPGYQVLIGALTAYLAGHMSSVAPEASSRISPGLACKR
jgi:hypothetical protein